MRPDLKSLLGVVQPILEIVPSATVASIRDIARNPKGFDANKRFVKVYSEVSKRAFRYRLARKKLEKSLQDYIKDSDTGVINSVLSLVKLALPRLTPMILPAVTAVLTPIGSAIIGASAMLFGGFTAMVTAAFSLVASNPLLFGAAVGASLVATGYLLYRYHKYTSTAPMGVEDEPVDKPVDKPKAPQAPQVSPLNKEVALKPKGNYSKVYARVQEWRVKLNLDAVEDKYGLPRGILPALMAQESQGNPNARSHAGASGLFQFMPGTAKHFKIDPLNPEQSADAAAKYLSRLYKEFGDWGDALRAYNGGEGSMRKHKAGKPSRMDSKENKEYAPRIAAHWEAMNTPVEVSVPVKPVQPKFQEGEPSVMQPKREVYKPSSTVSGFIAPTTGRLTSPFGERIHPIKRTRSFHKGVDIANAVGTPIYASASGEVTKSGYGSGGAGLMIALKHGKSQTRYMHMSKLLVGYGEKVTQGQLIGKMGNTGGSTGPHLHFEVWADMKEPSDPIAYITDGAKTKQVALTPNATYEDVYPTALASNKQAEFYKTKHGVVKT